MAELLRSADALHSDTESLKVPPHSLQAEQAVLGGLMLDNASWDTVADHVSEEDFYRRNHRLIFRAIAELAEKNDPFDAVTLSEWLDQNQLLCPLLAYRNDHLAIWRQLLDQGRRSFR